MSEQNPREAPADHSEPEPYRVRMPRFISEEEIGMGDVVKRAASAFGIDRQAS